VVAQGYALLVSRGDNVEILFGREPASEPLGQDQGFISYVIREVSFFCMSCSTTVSIDHDMGYHNQMVWFGQNRPKKLGRY
jgi:hypothetical protein